MTRCVVCDERPIFNPATEYDAAVSVMCAVCVDSWFRLSAPLTYERLAWAARRARRYAVKRERAKR